MSVPSMTMLPLSGFSSPMSALRKTDLPVPDGPSITQISPAGTVRVTSPQMSCLPKDLVRSSTLISTPTSVPPLLCHWLDTPTPRARNALRSAQAYQRVNKPEVTAQTVTHDTCPTSGGHHVAAGTSAGGEGTRRGREGRRVPVVTAWPRLLGTTLGTANGGPPRMGGPPFGGVAGCCWVVLRRSRQRARVT